MTRTILFLVVFAVLGAAAGYAIFSYGLGGTPKVAVMNGPLWVTDFNQGVINFELANAIETKLDFVANDPDIKAVVVRINSPGGEATSSERLLSAMANVRRGKPVVVSSQWLLASGAYMMALGANYVFATSISDVGSIGVVSFIFPRSPPSEFVLGTGPSKAVGPSERTSLEELELAKESFYAMVQSQRGERITLSKDELLQGRTWLGAMALQLGLVDELGGEQDAIRKAAELAGLRRYQVVQVEEEMAAAGGIYAEAVETARAHNPDVNFIISMREVANPLVFADLTARAATDSVDRLRLEAKQQALQVSTGPAPHLYYLYLPPAGS